MKTILKALFLLVALTSAVPVLAQSDFEATKARAESGDAEAQVALGLMYMNGRGVAKNDFEAVRWYRLAAEQGNANAQSWLGYMYANGAVVEKNDQEAVRWYRLAAEQGDALAQYALRSFFETTVTSREYFIDGLVVILSERKSTRCDQGGDYSINITGDIGPDSSFAIEELLKISPSCIDTNGAIKSRTTVTLSSAGGLLEDGYKMGQLFRSNGVHTKIDDEGLCASSCAVAYLGGVDRTMSEDAVIMFHSPYFLELNARGERVPNCDVGSESSAKLLSYYQEMTSDDVGQRLMDRTLSYCSADDGWVLRGANSAELFGVATKI